MSAMTELPVVSLKWPCFLCDVRWCLDGSRVRSLRVQPSSAFSTLRPCTVMGGSLGRAGTSFSASPTLEFLIFARRVRAPAPATRPSNSGGGLSGCGAFSGVEGFEIERRRRYIVGGAFVEPCWLLAVQLASDEWARASVGAFCAGMASAVTSLADRVFESLLCWTGAAVLRSWD